MVQTYQDLDIPHLIDNKRMGGLQYWTIALCSLAIFLDGFDTQIIGFVAPAIVKDLKVDRSSLALVFAAGLVGLLMGSLILGRAADKFGRRPTIIFSTVLFALCVLATTCATELRQLIVLRLITGFGLGSVIPNAAALVGEYTPRHRRALTVNALSVAFTIGAAASAFLASLAVPRYGWHSVFYVGGLVPLVLAGLMVRFLPESLRLLVLHHKYQQALRWYRRLLPAAGEVDPRRFVVSEPLVTGSVVTFLFKERRAVVTIRLWGACFFNLLILYFLANWLPTLVDSAGVSMGDAISVGTAEQVGGAMGGVALGALIDRVGFRQILALCFIVAALSIHFIGHPGLTLTMLCTLAGVAGFCIVGGQASLTTLAVNLYPTEARSTGVGWALAVGRFGAILGQLLGGKFINAGMGNSVIFSALAVPAVLTALLVWTMRLTGDGSVGPATRKKSVA